MILVSTKSSVGDINHKRGGRLTLGLHFARPIILGQAHGYLPLNGTAAHYAAIHCCANGQLDPRYNVQAYHRPSKLRLVPVIM